MTRCAPGWRLLGLFTLLLCVGNLAAKAQDETADPAYQALLASNVFVDPNIKHLDEAHLQAAALNGLMDDGNPHTRVKIAVWRSLPPPYTNLDTYAHILGNSLQIGNNALIVVVAKGSGRGASIVTESKALPKSEADAIIRQTWPEITQNETYGIADLAEKVSGKINLNEYKSSEIMWLIFLVVIIVISSLVYSASKKRKQEMAERRGPIDALRSNVLSGIEYLDNYADVLPRNNPDSDQVRIFRQAASTKFDQAVKILVKATEMSDLNRAQGLLDRAQADVQRARQYLDRATGGTSNIPGDDAMRPEPLPENQSDVNAIPQNRRGVSFFSSRPAPLGSLVPVTITINGANRQVLVTPEEADEMRQGRMPRVRAFQVNGNYVPWYAYSGYDPYNDYWGYQNSGWSGFAAGFIGAELLDTLMTPVGMPYAFATDNSYYQGYNDSMQYQNGNDFMGGGFSGGDNSGFGDGGFGGDSSPYDDTAGINFDDNGGTGDFGNDSGGSDFDSGGSDFDSSGSDFGGGDF